MNIALALTRHLSSPRILFVVVAALSCSANTAFAQNGFFANLFLDGGAGQPFITFDTGGAQPPDYIAATGFGLVFASEGGEKMFIRPGSPDEAVTLHENGVGIGTEAPDSQLHVFSDGNNYPEARVTVENSQSPTENRTMFQLINNGGSRFNFVDTSLGTSWVFSSNGSGDFSVSLNGTGGSELKVQKNGRVIMGPGGAPKFDLRPSGNLFLDGTLIESSDRNVKQDIHVLDAQEVLEKIKAMPVTEWSYKNSPKSRHIGPMAQDFYEAFRLGEDNRHISPRDIASVSLVAIKAQQKTIDAQQETINQLQDRLEKLEAAISRR